MNTTGGSTTIAANGKLALWLALLGAGIYVAFAVFVFDKFKLLIPNELTINLFGFQKVVRNVPDRVTTIATLFFVLIPVAFMIEAAMTGWKKCSVYRLLFARTDSMKLDIGCLLAAQAQLYSVIKLVLTLGLAAAVGRFINTHFNGLFEFTKVVTDLHLFFQVPAYFLILTFFDYWDHRIVHARIFWPLHRFHHSARDFCMITTARQHPVSFVSLLLINLPMTILGASLTVLLYVNALVAFVGLLQHSNIDSNFGWIGRWLVQSPNHHRKHHILDISKPVGNFSMFPLWDRLFGTDSGEANESTPIGVDKPYRHGYLFFIDVVRDYADFFKGLFGIKVDPYDFSQARGRDVV